ncbi:MAG: hypothetical protein M3O41_13340 [Pseudomonadota bacterium]|nr:hypothetical protein [Pseudomonadota bacterium]
MNIPSPAYKSARETGIADVEGLRSRNQSLAKRIILDIGKPDWGDIVDDDVVFEFPYGESIERPTRIAGKAEVIEYLKGVIEFLGLEMYDVVNTPALDPSVVYNEYKGRYRKSPGVVQHYISLQKFRDGRLVLQREYWDPTPVRAMQRKQKQ